MATPSSGSRALVLSVLLAGSCATSGWRRTELFLGLSIPGGGQVSDADFQGFVDEEVATRFPDGFTVLSGTGQWREKTGVIAREPSRVIVLLHPPGQDVDVRIEAIRAAYRKRFRQEAVLRTDSKETVSFQR